MPMDSGLMAHCALDYYNLCLNKYVFIFFIQTHGVLYLLFYSDFYLNKAKQLVWLLKSW